MTNTEAALLSIEIGKTIHRVKRHIERDHCKCCAEATGLSDLIFDVEREQLREAWFDRQGKEEFEEEFLEDDY